MTKIFNAKSTDTLFYKIQGFNLDFNRGVTEIIRAADLVSALGEYLARHPGVLVHSVVRMRFQPIISDTRYTLCESGDRESDY
jgi:hypothetical protein